MNQTAVAYGQLIERFVEWAQTQPTKIWFAKRAAEYGTKGRSVTDS